MQKLLDLIRYNLIARIFVHIFIFNFFCLQTFGMFATQPVNRSRVLCDPKLACICNSPKTSVSFSFLDNDFILSYSDNGYSETFSKNDTVFNGERYILNLGNSGSFLIDELAKKVYCYNLLTSTSLSFSAIGCSLMIDELICDGLITLLADNVCITGVLSSSEGSIINALGNIENFGTIDAPQVMMISEQIHHSGRITGKNVSLNADMAEFKDNSITVATEHLGIKSQNIDVELSSLVSKNISIAGETFEATSSVINSEENFVFNEKHIRLKEQCELSVGKLADIHSERFSIYESKVEADDIALALSSVGESFANHGGEISASNDVVISAKGSILNEHGKIESRNLLKLICSKASNIDESLLEGGTVHIVANNAVNHKSLIRSLLGDTTIKLKIKDDKFIPNSYVHTTSHGKLIGSPEDKFTGERFANINTKFPRPKQQAQKSDPQTSSTTTDSNDNPKSGVAPSDSSSPNSSETQDDVDNKKEIGSFLNYSGEIISAGELFLKGSGSLYNVVDSTIDVSKNLTISFYGKILNKSRSTIKSKQDIDMLAKMGITYCENGFIDARNINIEAREIGFDEFSAINGFGKLQTKSDKLINRGKLHLEKGIDIAYGWFDNSGYIFSKDDISMSVLKEYANKSFTNQNGEIYTDKNISIESVNVEFCGKIKARDLLYKFYCPAVKQYTFLINTNVECAHAVYDFGVADLIVNTDLDLMTATEFIVGGFYNEAVIKAKAPLTIKAKFIQNGYEHNLPSNIQNFNGYNLAKNEFDFQNNTDLSVEKSDNIYIRPEKSDCNATIVCEDILTFDADELLYNSGTIESAKKIVLNGNKVQTGWATWDERTLQLPFVQGAQRKYKCHDGVFDFPYDFYTPQKSIIRSYGDIEINCNKFISSFGNVHIFGGLKANIGTLFLNYAGDIMIGNDSLIRTKEFVNTIGTMATNDAGLQYWKISAATTDPATLLCNGKLEIEASKYFKNRASYLSSTGDMLLNGKVATGLLNGIDSKFVNESVGTEYCRMYTISGVDVSTTSHRCIGIKCGSSTTTTYWWQEINELVKNNVIRSAISSAQSVIEQGFAGATNTGVIDAQTIHAKAIGDLGFSHGDRSRLQFTSKQSNDKVIKIEHAVNKSDLFSDYLFSNQANDDVKIPFVIINDGSVSDDELKQSKPAMTIPEYEQMMYREMLRNYSTARLSDMPTFEAGTILAAQNSKEIGSPVILPHFENTATVMSLIQPQDVKAGIYFRPYKYEEKYFGQITLFPELYLSETSLHNVLRDSYGAMHAEQDIQVETTGHFAATASMSSGDQTYIKAKSATIETQTFDKHTVTSKRFSSASGCGLLGSKTTGIKTQWEKLTASRSPVLITTGKGLGICLQKGETAKFQGIVANLQGGLHVKNGSFVLTPLMVTDVSANENGSYVIPEYLKTILDVNGDVELDVDVFENTGSEIHATGKMKIKANQVAQAVLSHEYLANESYGSSQSFFSSKVRHEKCYAQKVVMPVMTADDIDIKSTGRIDLEGLITSENDIKLLAHGDISMASRAFYQTMDYSEKLSGPFTNARVRRFFENPQIAPNIVRANGDFILNTLENYYATGVQAEIIGRKTVNAKNVISRPLKVRQRNEIISEVTNLSIGLPASVLNASFSMQFSDAGKQLLSQHPMYQAVDSLFCSKSQAHRASALANVGLATHDTFKTISEALANSGGNFTSRTALELAAKFFN